MSIGQIVIEQLNNDIKTKLHNQERSHHLDFSYGTYYQDIRWKLCYHCKSIYNTARNEIAVRLLITESDRSCYICREYFNGMTCTGLYHSLDLILKTGYFISHNILVHILDVIDFLLKTKAGYICNSSSILRLARRINPDIPWELL